MFFKNVILVAAMLSVTSGYAQKVKLTTGTLTPLSGQDSINIEFNYDSLLVGGYKVREKEFVKELYQRWEEKQPGSGKDWANMWFDGRKELYEPAFCRKFLEHAHVAAVKDKSLPITLLFKTRYVEPGWTGGVLEAIAEVSGEAWFVDTNDRSKVIAKVIMISLRGKDGHGGDFEMSRRIQQAYEQAGKGLGMLTHSKMRKKH